MKRKTTKPTKPTTPTTPKASAKDATAEKVLNLLLAKLQAGVNAWKKPWDSKGNPTADPRFFAVNLFTGKPYSGINCSTLEAGFYAGFSQITANGGKVKKGSNAYPVVWFGSFEKDLDEAQQQEIWNVFDVNESKPSSGKYGPCYRFAPNFYEVYNVYLTEDCDLEKVTKVCKVLKTENVFSIEDTEGLEKFVEKFWAQFKGEEKSKIFNANENGDLWIDAYCIGAKLGGFHHNGGNSSYYAPATDSIHLAKKTAYHSPAEYYSTAFHEMTHSSGAASRLNRDGIVHFDHFGSPRYAKEELIAEMGAAMAMGFLGIDTEGTNDNSAAYLGNWLHQKIGEKASEEALKTLMAASSSAKFAFAYIAEFYEAAKARKDEENKQKKTEEPQPMLPAVILPKPEQTARVCKAEPIFKNPRKFYALRYEYAGIHQCDRFETREEAEQSQWLSWAKNGVEEFDRIYAIYKGDEHLTPLRGYVDGKFTETGKYIYGLAPTPTAFYPYDEAIRLAKEYGADELYTYDERVGHYISIKLTAIPAAAAFKAEPTTPRYEFLQQPNALLLCNVAKTDPETRDYVVVWSICESDLSEDTNEAEFSALPESLKEQIKQERFARIHRKAQLLAKNPFIEPKGASAEFPELIGFGESFGGYVSVKENGEKVTYKMPDFFKKYRLIDRERMQACYRAMPNGEPCGVSPSTKARRYTICRYFGEEGRTDEWEDKEFSNIKEAEAYAESLTKKIESADALKGDRYFVSCMDGQQQAFEEYWVIIEGQTAIRVREGTGDNLSQEDIDDGYLDYIYYDTFDFEDGRNIAERAEEDQNSDGGLILLKSNYVAHTPQEIAEKVVAFVCGKMDADGIDWKFQKETPVIEEPDPAHYNDGMIDCHFIEFFDNPMAVMVNCDGDAETLDCTSNFYTEADLLLAYNKLWKSDWNMDDEKPLYVRKFKEWILQGGCDPELLEGND